MPGTRTLAAQLGVHRSTVISAYAELVAQGWLTARPGGKTTVCVALPEKHRIEPRRAPTVHEPGFDIEALQNEPWRRALPAEHPRGAIMLLGGMPDVRLAPAALLARAYRRAVRSQDSALMAYSSDARGHRPLRVALARLLRDTRGIACDEHDVIVTRGSQMAIALIARRLLRPGDRVAVEAPGYRPAWEAFARAGAELVPVKVDAGGLCVSDLIAAGRERPFRAIYVTPHHQYPTTTVMAANRRLELLELARATRAIIVEDDYDHEFHFEGKPVLPLASDDSRNNVMYVGTLSKVLAPGLRVGFAVARPPVIEALAGERFVVDRQGDRVLEAAITELLDDGELDRHVRRARRIYLARRDRLATALKGELGNVFDFELPRGGMALWARVRDDIDVDRLALEAAKLGVVFQPGRLFSFAGEPTPFARFGYAGSTEPELHEAVLRLKRALPKAQKPAGSSAPPKARRSRN